MPRKSQKDLYSGFNFKCGRKALQNTNVSENHPGGMIENRDEKNWREKNTEKNGICYFECVDII